MNVFKEPLTMEEEEFYLRRYKEGDRQAKDMLIECNMRLVAHIVKKYSQEGRETEELISIGTVGLIKAINTFDEKKGNKLVTYASKCIDNEILMHLRNERKRQKEVSIFEPIGTDKEGNAINLLDIIETYDKDIIEEFITIQNNKWLMKAIHTVLTDRERLIIIMRYGLFGKNPVTQREMSVILGISRSYVSRIEKKALKKLQKSYEESENR